MAGLTFNIFGNDVSASKALHGVEKSADGSTKKIGASFKKMAGIAAAAFAGAGAVDFLKGAVDEATEAQKVGAQTEAVLKSTGHAAGITATQIGDLSNSISQKVGIDDEAIQSGANLLLTFTNLKNGAGAGNDIFNQTTKIMTDMSVATGTDMKASAIQLGKALNDPIKGVSKLSKVGVTFTDRQKKQIAAMVKTGDTMGAQRVILKELNKEFGGSAEAQATPAEKAKVAWGNLQEQIGGYLLPVIAKLSNFLTSKVIPAFSKLVSWIGKNKDLLIKIAMAIAPLIAAWGVYAAITRTVAIAQGLLNAVMAANPIVLVVAAIGALVAAFVLAYNKSTTFRTIVQAAFNGIKVAALFLWNNVLKPIFAVWSIQFRVLWTVVKAVGHGISAAFTGIGNGLSWVWHSIIAPQFNMIKGGIRSVWRYVGPVVRGISGAFRGIGDGLVWAYNHSIGWVFGKIAAAVSWIQDKLSFLAGGAIKGQGTWAVKAPSSSGGGRGMRANAQGTGFFDGGWTRINERGNEIVHLPRGSRIDTASMSASRLGMGGGSNINVYVKVDGALNTSKDIDRAVTAAVTRGLNSGQRIRAPRGAISVS